MKSSEIKTQLELIYNTLEFQKSYLLAQNEDVCCINCLHAVIVLKDQLFNLKCIINSIEVKENE